MVLIIASSGCKPQRISEAENAVRFAMKDPDSTQFRDVQICVADKSIVRGDYNSKNEMGGYVGFKPFFYDGQFISLEDEKFTPVMNKCYPPTKDQSDDPVVRDADSALSDLREVIQAASAAK
ncbi:hypothetical protein J2X73_002502 [Novosphingobium sp. 1748]|nr:hypothetical protein [Novosphingobium sp. 1748]